MDFSNPAQTKADIIEHIIQQLSEQLKTLQKSAASAHSGATHEDALAKSKYDTHGLELSYLAGSQYERARALEADINTLRLLRLPVFDSAEPIKAGALIQLESANDSSLIFLWPLGAGLQAGSVKVISPHSPLGQNLMGLYQGDELLVPGKEDAFIVTRMF